MSSEHEERLERAMREHASTMTPTPDWDDVEQRAEELRRRRLRVRAGFTGLGLAAAIVLVVGLVSVLNDGEGDVQVAVTSPDTTTTEATTTTTATPPTTLPSSTVVTAVRPRPADAIFPSEGSRQFQDPGAAALAFGGEYLGMPDPAVESTSLSARVVEIRAKRDRPLLTAVTVVDSGGAWYVTGARTTNIDPVTPEPGDRVSAPVTITGRSTAFEAHVNWEVREDGQVSGQKLGEGFFLGGSNGEFGEFSADLAFASPTKPAGAIVLLTYSAEDGSVQEATVVRVSFG